MLIFIIGMLLASVSSVYVYRSGVDKGVEIIKNRVFNVENIYGMDWGQKQNKKGGTK